MKKLLALLTFLFTASFAFSQEAGKDTANTEYKIKTGKGKNMRVIIQKEGKNDTLDIDGPDSRKIMVISGKDKEDQDSIYFEMPRKRTSKSKKKVDRTSFFFDFGWNALMNKGEFYDSGPLELNYFKSSGINLGFQRSFGLIGEKFRIAAGLGLESNNFRFRNNTNISRTGDLTNFDIDTTSGRVFDKNKLTLTYLYVPLMLEFRSNPWKPSQSFNISAGAEVGYLLQAYTKQVYAEGTTTQYHKVFEQRDFNLAPFKASLIARVGYGNFSMFVRYGLTEMFRNTPNNPQAQSFMAGFTVIGF